MDFDSLLRNAQGYAKRSRPLESNFPVGACAEFSEGSIFGGANIEEFRKSTVGSCAERALLAAANSEVGPLSADGGRDNRPIWSKMAIWAPTEHPIVPCGICRDSLSGTGMADSELFSTGSLGDSLHLKIRDLLPLPGLGIKGGVVDELELFRSGGAEVVTQLNYEFEVLLSRASAVTHKSYIPPFSKEPRSGAALEQLDGSIVVGWFSTDATTRLGGSAITSAVRSLLNSKSRSENPVIRATLYTEGAVLRAPTGADLQILKEVAEDSLPILIACDVGERFILRFSELFPRSFGPKDLGY